MEGQTNIYFISIKKNYFPQTCTCHQIEKKIKEIYTFNRLFNYLQQFLIALGITYSTYEKRSQC